MEYPIEIDQEITIGDKTYSVFIDADIDYTNEKDPEPCGFIITEAEIAPLDGDPMPFRYEGSTIEKIIVEGHPELTEAIDKALWAEIQKHTEDNYRDIMRDIQNARDDYDL